MSDPITEAAAMLAAHPDPMVRLIAERLAGARVRRRAAGLSRDDVARRIGCRGRSSPTPRHSGLGCRRLRRPDCWPKSPGSDRGKSGSICPCWPLFGMLDADREPKRRAMPPTDRHPAAIGRAVSLGAVVCKQQARSPRLAGSPGDPGPQNQAAGQGGQKSGAFDRQPAVNVSASPCNSNFDPGDAGGRGCDADGWPLDPSSPSQNAGGRNY